MRKKQRFLARCAIAYLLFSSAARAFGLSLVPTSLPPEVGEEPELQNWADFRQDPTIGGGFDVVYDDEALDFVAWSAQPIGDPQFIRAPDIFPGLLEGIAFGDFAEFTGPALVGTLRFELVAQPTQSLLVALQETQSIAGAFISTTTFAPQKINYGGFSLPP